MTAVLLDTHAWAWTLAGDRRLSGQAVAAIEAADTVLVSPISFFEIAQKVRLGIGRSAPIKKRAGVPTGLTKLIVLNSEPVQRYRNRAIPLFRRRLVTWDCATYRRDRDNDNDAK